MAVDLGGIAKGYASDRLAELFAADGVSSAMVSLGGNVYVRGTKRDGSLWRVAIEDPNDTAAYLGVLSLQDRFIITSGGYQRYFERDGVTYYHIIDPKTGDVARSGLLSATVVSDNGTMGDALSTALFVMGREKAVQFWRTSGLDFDMVLCDDSGHVYYTEGLKESFDTSLAEMRMNTSVSRKTKVCLRPPLGYPSGCPGAGSGSSPRPVFSFPAPRAARKAIWCAPSLKTAGSWRKSH